MKTIGKAPATFRTGVVDQSFESAEPSDHSQHGTERAKHGAPEPPENEIEEENEGKEEPDQQALMEMGLPEGEDRCLQEMVKRLGLDGDEITSGKIEKGKKTVNQSVEDWLHGQGHGADEEGNRV